MLKLAPMLNWSQMAIINWHPEGMKASYPKNIRISRVIVSENSIKWFKNTEYLAIYRKIITQNLYRKSLILLYNMKSIHFINAISPNHLKSTCNKKSNKGCTSATSFPEYLFDHIIRRSKLFFKCKSNWKWQISKTITVPEVPDMSKESLEFRDES